MNPILNPILKAIVQSKWVQVAFFLLIAGIIYVVDRINTLEKKYDALVTKSEITEKILRKEWKAERDSFLVVIDRKDELYISSIKEVRDKFEKRVDSYENEKQTIKDYSRELSATQKLNLKLTEKIEKTADRVLKQQSQ